MARNYAAMPFEYLETLRVLSDAQFGRLMRWLLKYASTGEYGDLPGREKMFRSMVQNQEDRHQASYDKAVAARSAKAQKAARARWDQSQGER